MRAASSGSPLRTIYLLVGTRGNGTDASRLPPGASLGSDLTLDGTCTALDGSTPILVTDALRAAHSGPGPHDIRRGYVGVGERIARERGCSGRLLLRSVPRRASPRYRAGLRTPVSPVRSAGDVLRPPRHRRCHRRRVWRL